MWSSPRSSCPLSATSSSAIPSPKLRGLEGGPTMPTLRNDTRVATFSIVGFDPQTGDLGVAVQSKFLAVGAVVPFAKAGVGAVATQSWANTSYGPRGLDLLAAGKSPEEAVATLTGADDRPEQR